MITVVNQAPVADCRRAGRARERRGRSHVQRARQRHATPRAIRCSLASYDDSTIANGSLTSNGGGSFTYVPAAHFAGTDTFSYIVSDGNGNTATATVTITVTAVPDPPAAADDSYVTPQGVALVQPAPGVLANDSDSGGGALVVDTTPVVAPANGSLSLAADGSFTYTPTLGFTGGDTFTYRATSVASGLSSTAVVTITVSADVQQLPALPHRQRADERALEHEHLAASGSRSSCPTTTATSSPGLTIKSERRQGPSATPPKSQTWR